MATVSIIGGGVIGLTVAHELATDGHDVTVIAARDHHASVSSVAAAIWFPHAVSATARVLASASTSYDRLVALADDPTSGVRLRHGTVVHRTPDPDLSWTTALPDVAATPTGVRCLLPLAVTDVYLSWLRKKDQDLGVRFEARPVSSVSLDEVPGDAVVVAAGLGSAALVGGDDELYPIRGQVVRLANPGLTDWLLDGDNPAGLTYVVPRDHDVVCGGTDDVGSWDETIHDDVEAGILARVTALVPELEGQAILSRAVGLRPARSGVRLELVPGHPRPVIACYGHGGAGFTLSWGEAADVAALLNR
ncbi:FAD-dependent oxidoreductase [Actinoplanes solisilvae]|uniref:FAD-dependent oxidoreductase n=1 Tax=Actinoplanes solisilvae TaxID=2486853 RepID=UPI000FDC8060|nr:FAD-dependent oxidoreductase [Actinoplanes solisilvae]